MKKNKVKKLQLSRETLQVLTSSEVHMVVGASFVSCMTVAAMCFAAAVGTCPTKPDPDG